MQKLKIPIDAKFMSVASNGKTLAISMKKYLHHKIILDFQSKPPYSFTKQLFYSLWQSHSIEVIKDKLVIYDKSVQGLIEVIGVEFLKQTIKG